MKNIKSKNISISTDKSLLNIDLILDFLRNSYWAKDIPLVTVEKSIEHSHCFGVYEGKGIGKMLIKYILEFPAFVGLKRWHLLTFDAQGLYEKFGFSNPENPEYHMEIKNLNIYKNVFATD